MASRGFRFTVPLVRLRRGRSSVYILEVPERVTTAVRRRGPVPIEALLNGSVDLAASLVPMGGGRHWLQLNARIREELQVAPGDPVRVELTVPEKPSRLPFPVDLARALREAGLYEAFSKQPVGKQNHIILWILQAARPQTRLKRTATVVQIMLRRGERAYDRRADAV